MTTNHSKLFLFALMFLCTAKMQGAEDQKKLGWYDWSKQQVGRYAPYIPGAVTGLSGASLLALKGLYGSEEQKPWNVDAQDEALTWIAGSPIVGYEAAKGLIPYYLYGDIDASGAARKKFFGFLNNHNLLKEYAPHLLGTSAALLAAPYLYRMYRESHQPRNERKPVNQQRTMEQQARNRFWKERFWRQPVMQTIKLEDGIEDLLDTYKERMLERGFKDEEIAKRVQAIRKPLTDLLLSAKQGLLTDEQIEGGLHTLFWPQ